MKQRIIFIGDSITYSGKSETDLIGTGYVRLLHDYLKVTYPERDLDILNKGIGGNRVTDLALRWDHDVIDLAPDLVSVSIGINDVWRQLDAPDIVQVYPEQFEDVYNSILSSIKDKTNASIVLMEPTVITEDIHAEGNLKLKPYVDIVHKLAEKYQALIVPTHQAFLAFLENGKDFALTTDGVHMNSAGNMLMAKTWIEATKELFK
ncbi:SGNH/GDSL hydrolase family protein [Bacillus sinesaloumensis]|uniref:SGNH/GDSL hydrolase family protein n=1 Tax=Litchfieldia sinesaloumensis TaxID=1926280 RepID=UPI0009886AFE|nr:SGNH/GDSL hydrolase family protein [Bacillus sinesaloumensis]